VDFSVRPHGGCATTCEQQAQIVEAELAAIGLPVRVRIFAFSPLNALIPRAVSAA
jgi:hypothetical protein